MNLMKNSDECTNSPLEMEVSRNGNLDPGTRLSDAIVISVLIVTIIIVSNLVGASTALFFTDYFWG